MQNPSWKNILIQPNASVADAIQTLNRSGQMFLIVVDEHGKLVGNITDGDLRKGLIRHQSMDVSVENIMNKNTIFVDEPATTSYIEDLFKNPNIRAIPRVDNNRVVTGCYFLDDFQRKTSIDAHLLIMAGGYGKRMGSLTKSTPKPMLKIDGKPILEHMIENATDHGFSEIKISLHYLSDNIKSHFGDGSSFGVNIQYIHENTPLGTAGCISLIEDDAGPMIVINGDILTNVDFTALLQYHNLMNAAATMATQEHVISNPYGVVKTDGVTIVGLEEKPKWKTNVNAGIYVIELQHKHLIKPNKMLDMPDFFSCLIENELRTVIYPLPQKVIEIGSPENYHEHA
jgi:dTDP-glucose pyrophosphorylase